MKFVWTTQTPNWMEKLGGSQSFVSILFRRIFLKDPEVWTWTVPSLRGDPAVCHPRDRFALGRGPSPVGHSPGPVRVPLHVDEQGPVLPRQPGVEPVPLPHVLRRHGRRHGGGRQRAPDRPQVLEVRPGPKPRDMPGLRGVGDWGLGAGDVNISGNL